MLKLVRLEWKKNNIGKYIKGVIIMAALLGLFVFALAFFGYCQRPPTERWTLRLGQMQSPLPLNYLPAWLFLFTPV